MAGAEIQEFSKACRFGGRLFLFLRRTQNNSLKQVEYINMQTKGGEKCKKRKSFVAKY